MIPANQLDAFRSTLIAGGYNLLLGSGTSLDSTNGTGELLRSAETLRRNLCALKSVNDSTNLSRVYSLLDLNERERELIKPYSGCRAGRSLTPLPNYIWRRLFTFNLDDVIESLYENSPAAKQTLVPLNFDASFEPTPARTELQAIHLHGWVRSPESGFVFSYSEYARIMSGLNPWMHLMSEILATESFIIAGTSLNEVDLEYYLSYRSEATPRRGKGPSLLIEPNPDAVTVADCKRFGLVLVQATFGEFLAWIQDLIANPPTLTELIVPDLGSIFADTTISAQLLKFFSDFQILKPSEKPRSALPSPFMYGRTIQQEDLDQHLDIQRADTASIELLVKSMVAKYSSDAFRLLIVFDEAGSGKTTLIQRIGYNLACVGQPVLTLHTLSRIDTVAAIDAIESATTLLLLLVDGIADHVEQINEILRHPRTAGKVVVLASERSYRQEHVDLVLSDLPRETIGLTDLSELERRTLIELYREFGLVADPIAIRKPSQFTRRLGGDPIAVAACRILNDFRPLESIVTTLWNDTFRPLRTPYLCVALARHCHAGGIGYSILQAICGVQTKIADLFTANSALGIVTSPNDDDYVVPLNSVLAERVLLHVAQRESDRILDAFSRIADGLAPHVNRLAIMRRTPEARLAGRLFDSDKIVKPFLGKASEQFFIAAQNKWEWNSRYWEQRALLVGDIDLERGLGYARHAVALEEHPFPLTTLGKLLLRKMEHDVGSRASMFDEAIGTLAKAIGIEANRSRTTIHPYMTLLSGAAQFVELGETLSPSQRTIIMNHLENAEMAFSKDVQLKALRDRLARLLGRD